MKRFLIGFLPLLLQIVGHAQIKWDGGAGDGQWSSATNWTTDLVPSSTDNVILDNSLVIGNYAVTFSSGTVSVVVNSLAITPSSGNIITLLLPKTNTSSTAFLANGSGDAVVLNNGAIFKNSSGASSGSPVSVTTTNFFRINNGGRYIHNCPRAHTITLVARLSTVTGTENGVFEFDVPQSGFTVSFASRTFGNLELSSTANNGIITYLASGGGIANVNGNLVIKTGVTFSLDITNAVIINGNLDQSNNSTLNISSNSANTPLRIKGNINSDGTITESSNGQPYIELNGITNQNIITDTISGDKLGFIMNNVAGAVLLSPLTIPFDLNLQQGKIKTTSANLITMIDNSSTNGSTESFIDGPMKKIGDEAFIFPIGTGSIFAPVIISAGANSTDAFTAEYIRINPQSIYGTNYDDSINHISYVEYWNVFQTSGVSERMISLSVTSYSFAKKLNTLRVGYSDGTPGFQWQNKGLSSYTTGPPDPPYMTGTITSIPVSTFGIFTLGTTDEFVTNPLPVQLVQFNIMKSGLNNLINWELTDYCSEEVKFEIEASKDALNFFTIAIIHGSEISRNYQYKCPIIKENKYYRLRIIDTDLIVSYSHIISIFQNERDIMITSVVPSLVYHSVNIKLSSPKRQKLELAIIDILGRMIKTQTEQLVSGDNIIKINCSDLPAGNYFLLGVSSEGKTNLVRFVKLRL